MAEKKKNNHFVPRFYLRGFGTGEFVPVYNIKNRKFIPRASLSGQCQRPYFYGATPHIENALADLEGVAAQVIRAILRDEVMPPKESPDYVALITFIWLQDCRTPHAGDEAMRMMNMLFGAAMRDMPDAPGPVDDVELVHENPVLFVMGVSARMIPVLLDLRPVLLRNDSSVGFVTSDCPVVKFNQWAQGITDRGVLGAASRGLQLFLPLSPSLLLAFYDPSVYATNKKIRLVSSHSVQGLNALQLTTAVDNFYFDGRPETLAAIERLPFNWRQAATKRNTLVEAESMQDTSSLLHTFRTMVGELKIPEIRVKPQARAIPMHERGNQLRYSPTDMRELERLMGMPEPPPPPRQSGIFRPIRRQQG